MNERTNLVDFAFGRLWRAKVCTLLCLMLMLAACSDNGANNNGANTSDSGMQNDAGADSSSADGSDDSGTPCTTFSGRLTDEQTLSGCVRVTNDITVADGGYLIIEPGTEMHFAEQTEILVEAGGRMKAEGSADAGILMTGEQQIAGFWSGVKFEESHSVDNIFGYVTLEYAGIADERGALHVEDYWGSDEVPRIAIENTTIRHSAGPALVLYGWGTDVRAFANNTLTDSQIPARAHINLAHVFEATSTFTGNAEDRILLWDDENVDGATIEDDQTWKNIGVPFVVTQSLSYKNVALSIEPGVTVLFSENAGLVVWDGATLEAVGTEDDPIVFDGDRDIAGYWLGLAYVDSSSVDNLLEYVVIDDAGGDRTRHDLKDAAIGLNPKTDNATLTINHSTIRDSAAWGIWLGDSHNTSATLSGCTEVIFENTALGDIGAEGDNPASCPFP